MSVFLLPVELCKDLEMAMCKFWWRSNPAKEKCIHWMSWSRMSKRKSDGGMGFRSLRDFNVALLGNQGWRLLTQPDRLVSKVYKARYFPTGSFLNAKLGSNPSYIWRSVLESQGIIKQGVGCRVGNGHSVSIIEDPWLPSVQDPYVHTVHEALQNQKVTVLMITGEHSWDRDLIFDIFEERDANLIVSIPLNNEVEDSWYWRHEKMGKYSVKSSYMLIQGLKNNNHSGDNSGFWRKLWNLKIPPKVKNFLWRASTNCLPTKDLLRMRRVDVDVYCPMCNEVPESVLHCLVTCTFAEACWVNAAISIDYGDFTTFPDWLQVVFEHNSTAEIHKVVMICWMLWKNRNELIWKQKSLDPAEVVQSALSVLSQWKSVQDKTFDCFLGFMTHEDGREHWQPPMINRVKVNSDATIFEDSNSYSFALVARDHNGELVEAVSKCRSGNVSPELAEAMGGERSVKLD